MPWRIHIPAPPPRTFDQLVDLGALDIESTGEALEAILPDTVSSGDLALQLGIGHFRTSQATPRDDGSVWLLRPRPQRIGSLLIAPADAPYAPDTLRLTDSPEAFGTGHHSTTILCIETLEELLTGAGPPESLLDVGTGSGILALAALLLGVPSATGVDVDENALRVAAENARRNRLEQRLRLIRGGPDAVEGTWPLVTANILTAPLIEMAPTLVRRVASRGWLILSGIRDSLASDVTHTYRNFGLHDLETRTRDGWAMLLLRASW